MRIGDILVEQHKLQRRDLLRALDDQPRLGQRICSILIERGELEYDDAARALGEQKGVPCALERHLEQRDPELARAIPEQLARARGVLALGRTKGGELIACARDPSRELADELGAIVRSRVLVVIAPASRLDALVDASYLAQDFDVELDSMAGTEPPLADPLDPESVRYALTNLDDERVAKDPTQSGQWTTLTPPTLPPRAQTQPGPGTQPPLRNPGTNPRIVLPPPAPKLDVTRDALAAVTSRDAATDLAIAFVAGRWLAGLVVAIRGRTAIGYRGHGASLPAIESVLVPLDEPSILARAIETRKTSVVVPQGTVQELLTQALGRPAAPAAAPILVGEDVVAVIAVGDSIHGIGDTEAATAELGQLAQALGAAWQRIVGR